MNKEQKIKLLENTINDFQSSVNEAKKQLEELKNDDCFELPDYLTSFIEWNKRLSCSPGNDILTHLDLINISRLPNAKTYAQLKLQYIADTLNDGDCNDGFYINKRLEIHPASYGRQSVTDILFNSDELAKKAIDIMGDDMNYLKG